MNRPIPHHWLRRWLGTLFILSIVFAASLSLTSNPVEGQSTFSLGVGRGHGLEVGINVDALNQIRADVNAGVYDRPCTAAEHDPNRWHTLVNIEAKCHYDHHHGDDPNYVADIFGEPGGWFGRPGQSISYPWQTYKTQTINEPNDAYVAAKQMENDLKHEGYTWIVRRDQQCQPGGNCLTDFRLQVHAIFGAHDAPVRFHSYSFEGRVCKDASDPSTCGLIRTAGWADTGKLFVTAQDDEGCGFGQEMIRVPLPADSYLFPLVEESPDEIRCHPILVNNLPAYPSPNPVAEWWAFGAGDRLRFQVRSYDPIGNVNPSDPAQWHTYCAENDPNCRYDQSIMTAWIGYVIKVRGGCEYFDGRESCLHLDLDGDGYGDLSTYTTRFGDQTQNCTAPGIDCVPLQYSHVYMNAAQFGEAAFHHTICTECPKVDHDISPAGKRWNVWFYRYVHGGGHTDPDPTPIPEGAAVIVEVTPEAANPGDSVNVAFKLSKVENVYGLQTECTVDPAVLGGGSRADGDAFKADNSFFVDSGFQPDGKWVVAASRLQPHEPFSGDGTAFSLSYNVLSAGANNLSCSVLAVDVNGDTLPIEVVNGHVVTTPMPQPTAQPTTEMIPTSTPSPTVLGAISGEVTYQNRPDNAGILVRLYTSEEYNLVGEFTTDATGAYTFTDVMAGSYKLLLSAPQHIPVVVDAVIGEDGTPMEAGSAVLRSGDTDDNGTVDVVDATFIGANFNVAAPPAPSNADLNGDATVNITDLVLVGSNFGAVSPLAEAE